MSYSDSKDRPSVSIVWFKRDLRLSDHEPLRLAIDAGLPIVLLYIFEPMLLEDTHYSERHWRFVTESITDMNRRLKPYRAKITIAHKDAKSVFSEISNNFNVSAIYSHQEIGLANTFEHDIALKRWLTKNNFDWFESHYAAVQRGLKNRDRWDQDWTRTMRSPLLDTRLERADFRHIQFDTNELPQNWKQKNPMMKTGGQTPAEEVLTDFFVDRGKDYHWQISKPEKSRVHCSRLSPYLAWGNISLREFYQRLLSDWNREGWRRVLAALSSRLH